MKTNYISLKIAAFALLLAFAVCLNANAGSAELVADLSKQVDNNAAASDELKQFIKDKLLVLCTNPVFVTAVTAQNAKNNTLDAIKALDDEWINAEDELPLHKEMLSNTCAVELNKVAASIPAITETFIMDHMGANVGQNTMTSDYWQGDESKWKNSFNNGKGGIDIDKPKLDKSTNRVDQKVSLPIINAMGSVIGAICIGVSL